MQPPNYIPLYFTTLSIMQIEHIEHRAIHTHNNTVRFDLMKAAKGDLEAQRRIMKCVKQDPSWIGL